MSGSFNQGASPTPSSAVNHTMMRDGEDAFDPGAGDISNIGPDIDPAKEPADTIMPDEDLPSAGTNTPYSADENDMDVLDALDDTDEQRPLSGTMDSGDEANTTRTASLAASRDGLTEHPDGSAPPLTRLVEAAGDDPRPLDELIQPAPSEHRG